MAAPPPRLPDALLDEPPTVKLLYLWLLPQGEVACSQRAIAAALGITQANVSLALKRLRALGLVEDLTPPRARVRGRVRVVGASAASSDRGDAA